MSSRRLFQSDPVMEALSMRMISLTTTLMLMQLNQMRRRSIS
jgi:hypothetical protein